jgi:hypothetical protein
VLEGMLLDSDRASTWAMQTFLARKRCKF